MKKERYLTGITASGNLTLGNYIGSIKKILELQNSHNDLMIFVADLHGMTNINNSKKNYLYEKTINILRIYISCGIDPKKVKIFKQSEINGHTKLFYYLMVHTNIGQLNRMTQFKDKTIKNENKTSSIPTGILLYPILMASDIILHKADIVPVGKDQKQHLELTIDIVNRINKKYNLNLSVPKPLINEEEEGSKIMALKEPEKKMSKSDENNNNVIFLLDDEKSIIKKIMASKTDSEDKVYYDRANKPGVSNLLTIYSVLKKISIKESEEIFKDKDYKFFKEEVSKVIVELTKKIKLKYEMITNQDIESILALNREEINKEAEEVIDSIEKGMNIKNEK